MRVFSTKTNNHEVFKLFFFVSFMLFVVNNAFGVL